MENNPFVMMNYLKRLSSIRPACASVTPLWSPLFLAGLLFSINQWLVNRAPTSLIGWLVIVFCKNNDAHALLYACIYGNLSVQEFTKGSTHLMRKMHFQKFSIPENGLPSMSAPWNS